MPKVSAAFLKFGGVSRHDDDDAGRTGMIRNLILLVGSTVSVGSSNHQTFQNLFWPKAIYCCEPLVATMNRKQMDLTLRRLIAMGAPKVSWL